MTIFLFLIISLFSPSKTFASLCPSFSSLGGKVKRCEDNFALGEQAISCLEKYTKLVRAGQANVKKILSAELGKMKDKQNGSFNASDASYDKAQKELNRLIAEGEEAKLAVDSFIPEIFFPEDWDHPEVTHQNPASFLKNEPCYEAPRAVITGSSDTIAEMVADLKKSKVVAGIKDDLSKSYSKSVDAIHSNRKILNKAQQAAPNASMPPKKTSKGSGVSGAVESNKSFKVEYQIENSKK